MPSLHLLLWRSRWLRPLAGELGLLLLKVGRGGGGQATLGLLGGQALQFDWRLDQEAGRVGLVHGHEGGDVGRLGGLALGLLALLGTFFRDLLGEPLRLGDRLGGR